MILQNYVCEIPGFFTDKEVQEFHTYANTLPVDEGRVGDNFNDQDSDDSDFNINDSIRRSTVKWFKNDEFSLMNKINDGIHEAKEISGWGHEYSYIENLQYTIYQEQENKKGDFYTWHTDAGPDVYDNGMHRKLSFTIQLTDPDEYEGGHFQWLEPQNEFNKLDSNLQVDLQNSVRTIPFSAKAKGSMIVFPSFLYHQVTPVLRGTRISLVGWCVGNRYV
jgi:PKHD-type hydroxylase